MKPEHFRGFFSGNSGYQHRLAVFLLIGMIGTASACTPLSEPVHFDPEICMETVPQALEGLKIFSGSRTEQNILRDMVSPICNAHVLFQQMSEQDSTLQPGKAVFKVTVEYTGEVYAAEVVESAGLSEQFLRKAADLIMDTDFVSWVEEKEDATVFLYPVHFGQ